MTPGKSVTFTIGEGMNFKDTKTVTWSVINSEGKEKTGKVTYTKVDPNASIVPFYGEWIRSYAGEDYQKTNDALVELMDTLAESCTEAEYQRLEEIFINCSRYELGFWEMAWTLER